MGPFLKNAWYAAAWNHEVSVDSPLARRILNEPLVLFRDTAGKVVALEDRCCHRHLPLSQGKSSAMSCNAAITASNSTRPATA